MTILQIEHDLATRTIRLNGELDHSSAPDLLAILTSGIDNGSDVHLDLRGLTFMDSTGLHIIVDTTRALTEGAALVLVDPPPPVSRVLELAAIVDQIPNLRVVRSPGPEVALDLEPAATGDAPLHEPAPSLAEVQDRPGPGRRFA